MPEIPGVPDDVAAVARDAAYVVVGLGILGFQKIQAQRAALEGKVAGDLGLEDRLADVRTVVTSGVQHLDGIVEGAVQLVESTLQPLEEQLPPPVRDLAQKAHAQARQIRAQIRSLIAPAA